MCVCVCVRACRLTSRMSNSQEFKLRSETLSESAVSDMVCDLQILVSRFHVFLRLKFSGMFKKAQSLITMLSSAVSIFSIIIIIIIIIIILLLLLDWTIRGVS